MRTFHPRFNEAILNGTKDTTVRMSDDRCVGEIEACVNPSRLPGVVPRVFAWIQYTHVYAEWELGIVDPIREGFAHTDDLIRFLNEVYNVEWNRKTKIVLYEFKKVDQPEIK